MLSAEACGLSFVCRESNDEPSLPGSRGSGYPSVAWSSMVSSRRSSFGNTCARSQQIAMSAAAPVPPCAVKLHSMSRQGHRITSGFHWECMLSSEKLSSSHAALGTAAMKCTQAAAEIGPSGLWGIMSMSERPAICYESPST